MKTVKIGPLACGNDLPLTVIAGPCQLESLDHAQMIAGRMAEACAAAGAAYVFKASYDKANRSSLSGRRGMGMEAGLRVLEAVRATGIPVLTDIHDEAQAREAATVVDVIQIPAFLCRQTDLLLAAGQTGAVVNIKKGQFLAPGDMKQVVMKAREAALQAAGGDAERADCIMVCERGASFGYNNLVSDMRSLAIMRETGCPVVFDATHSVQLPGGQGNVSGGRREFVPVLARAAVAAGVAGLFMETHPDPTKAKSDGPNAWPLAWMPELLATLIELDAAVKRSGFMEQRQWQPT